MSLLPELTETELRTLKSRTVIVTGGASGIGRAAVLIAHAHGANVAIADITEGAGEALAAELKDRILFHKTDVSNWDSVLTLFEATYQKFGSVDVVCANAGTNKWDNLLGDEFDSTSGKLKAPILKTIDINLYGIIYTAKAAVHYFARQPGKACQLVMTGSAASIIDTPPLHLYCASKAGVLGFMRSLRTQLQRKRGVSVNMVAPWMTVTPMLPQAIQEIWGELPANNPEGCAKALLLPAVRPEVNGSTLWVAGNQIYELEGPLHASQPQWMGKKLSEAVDEGQKRLIPLADGMDVPNTPI